jgi:TIR domain
MPSSRRYPLRGIGPLSFISYSFADVAEARKLFDGLQVRGFQTRMVDETVFIGKHLPTVLPELIGGSEMVALVLTERSNSSEWVRREFDWAQAHLAGKPGRAIIPVVLDEKELYAPIRDLGYIRAPGGIEEPIVDLVVRTALRTVWPLRLSEHDPLSLDASDVAAMLASSEPRRVILDAGGCTLDLFDQVKAANEQVAGDHRDAFLRQEKQYMDRLGTRLTALDVIASHLIKELRDAEDAFAPNFVREAGRALDLFIRLTLGSLLLRWANNFYLERCPWLAAHAERLRQFGTGVEAAEPPLGGNRMKLFSWALREGEGMRNETMMEVGIDAEGERRGVGILLPEATLGPDAAILLQIGELPEAMVGSYQWASLALPQIGALVWESVRDPVEAAEFAEKVFAWKIKDYRKMGLP